MQMSVIIFLLFRLKLKQRYALNNEHYTALKIRGHKHLCKDCGSIFVDRFNTLDLCSKMTNRLRDLNEALPEILVIDLLYLIIGEIVIFLLFENPAKFAVGFLAGVIYAIFCVLNMSFKVRKVVYGKANPKKSYLLGYLLRLTVMIAIFAILYLCDIGDLLAALVGMFIMKLSAYLQPAALRISSKILRKGGKECGEHGCDLDDLNDSL